jgi:hypothetical protein
MKLNKKPYFCFPKGTDSIPKYLKNFHEHFFLQNIQNFKFSSQMFQK